MKNWLIRTSDKKILGPVSEEKIIELIKQSKLSPTDEICLGNDIWFFIKEEDYLRKFLNITLEKPSEPEEKGAHPSASSDKEVVYPTDENMAYPTSEKSNISADSPVESSQNEGKTPQRRATDKKKK